ncbi:choice-of-anchor D domain-containing protein [Mariniflexile sp. HMF6888]|uniref:choice-of-anchor D domain-containing protein n=1 Tax=Mariniflexile sp. HMF6888 TaxID=3373086 RepID=UPI0037956184
MKNLKKPLALIMYALLLVVSCGKDDEPKLSPAQFSIDQSTVDFGEVEIPTSKEVKLTVTNTGEEDLVLKSFNLSGSNVSEFHVNASETEETLQAGKTYEFVVTFKPTEAGDKTAALSIISNVGEHKVNLSGKGTSEPAAVFNINPESKDFGGIEINKTAILNFTISNTGNAELVISESTLGGTNANEYSATNNSVTIPENGATGVKVTFAPQTIGNKTATLSIVTNVGTYTVNLQGNGISDPNIVNIPDANFKASLLAHGTTITGGSISKIDINDDGEIQISEAEAYKEAINCNDKSISVLTGIEAFVNITELIVTQNQLTLLDVSNNTALVKLNVDNNLLTSLDISKNLTLEVLRCTDNQLTGLDVSQNVNLNSITCNNNKLTTLDISKNTLLGNLYCFNNQITSLDISHNTGLRILNCSNNKLTALNTANGNNHNMIFMSALYNSLTCIQIDEGFTPHSDWRKDGTASYSTSCL